jgi:hypothetical protein
MFASRILLLWLQLWVKNYTAWIICVFQWDCAFKKSS